MTPTDALQRLKELVEISPNNFVEMTSAAKGIIDCWINAGFEYPSTYLEEFVSIDSQADCLRMSNDLAEKQSFYEDFRKVYGEEVQALRRFLDRQKK